MIHVLDSLETSLGASSDGATGELPQPRGGSYTEKESDSKNSIQARRSGLLFGLWIITVARNH